nr:E2F transcription factor-like E2FE [Ipomoea batatas]
MISTMEQEEGLKERIGVSDRSLSLQNDKSEATSVLRLAGPARTGIFNFNSLSIMKMLAFTSCLLIYSMHLTDSRKEKSLGLLTQNFIELFLCTNALYLFADKVRRLYDIASVLSLMKFIEKVPGSSSLRRDGDQQWAVVPATSDLRHPPHSRRTAQRWKQRSMSSSGGGNIRSTSSKDLSGGGCWWFVKRFVLAASVVTKSGKGLLVVATSRTTIRMEFAKDLELQSMQLFMDTQYGSIAHINLKLPPRDQDPPGYAFVEVI